MADLDLKYASDPTGDIISRYIQVFFGQRAIKETVAVNKISSTGMFNKVEKSITLGDSIINGTETCLGVTISYTILSQDINYIDPLTSGWAGMGVKATATYVPGEINVKVSWESYIPNQSTNTITSPTPNTGNVMPNASPTDLAIVLRAGFNLKCRNTTDIEDRGNGEIFGEDYNNTLIPDIEHGQNVGDNLILESMKNINIPINTIPQFRIKPRQYVQIPISYLFLNEILKIDSRDIHIGSGADQSFIINTRGRQY